VLKALAGNTKHSHVPLAAKPVRRVRLAWCAVSPFPQLPKESIPNAARCLQIADRGYVLDQGHNAYTGTGHQLLSDPKVIELYLGTLTG